MIYLIVRFPILNILAKLIAVTGKEYIKDCHMTEDLFRCIICQFINTFDEAQGDDESLS